MSLLITLLACRAELPTETNDIVGHDPEYGTAEVIITDDVPTDTGDSAEVEEDTAVEEDNCTFELIVSGNGRIEVSNELQFSLSRSPDDSSKDGLQEVFRFNVTSLHPECGDMTADTASFKIDASDNDGGETHWANGVRIEMVNLSVSPATAIMTGITDMNSSGDIYGPLAGILTIPAGVTYTFAVFMETSGASSDDMLQLALRQYMHILDTPETAAAVMMDDDLVGGAFIY